MKNAIGMYCGRKDGQFMDRAESCHAFAKSHLWEIFQIYGITKPQKTSNKSALELVTKVCFSLFDVDSEILVSSVLCVGGGGEGASKSRMRNETKRKPHPQ